MKSFLKSLPIFLIGIVVVTLMVANREGVIVSLAPLDYEMFVPLYLVFFGGLFFGLLLGGMVLITRKLQAQVNLHRANKANIRLREQIVDLEGELEKKSNAFLAASDPSDVEKNQRALAKEGG